VDINEAGRDKETLGIQARRTLLFFDRPNVEDCAIFDCHVCAKGWGCCAINNSSIAN
jgi:hypothetical protein